MTKDPFEILADELTLARRDIERLQRTSLDKDEARALNEQLDTALGNIQAIGNSLSEQNATWLDAKLMAFTNRLDQISESFQGAVLNVASSATGEAVKSFNRESIAAVQDSLRAAKEARRQAMRYRGGFWVWLGLACAVGALLVALGAFLITRSDNAKAFGQWADLYCTDAGGQKTTSERGGETYEVCVFWLGKAKP